MGPRHAALGILISCSACGISVVGIAPSGDGGLAIAGDASIAAEAGAGDEAGPIPDSDAGPIPAVDAGPVTIANAGNVAAPTGNVQQTHLVYAENGKRWWLFTITSDAASALQAWSSTDFQTWTAAGELTLPKPHKGQGSNFSVAYASIGAHDIVHLGIGLAGTGDMRTHYHARGSLDGATIAWSALTGISTVNDPALGDPEGGVTFVSASGRVTDFTGWALFDGSSTSTGNECALVAQASDDGASPWTSGFGGSIPIASATKTINARDVVSLGGEAMLTLWESADAEPDPANVVSSRTTGGAWSTPLNVFADKKFGLNDWGATALTADDVHAIRRTDVFEHRRYDGSTWRAGDAIPALAGAKKNAGLVVLHDAARVVLATIANDAVEMTTWKSGAWSDWKVVASASATRTSLSGWSSPTAGLGFVWTETENAKTRVAGVRVVP